MVSARSDRFHFLPSTRIHHAEKRRFGEAAYFGSGYSWWIRAVDRGNCAGGARSPRHYRATLAILFIGVLIAASFLVLRPFLIALIWGTMIIVATWPVLLWLQKGLWHRRWAAVAVMTAALLLVFIAPLSMAVLALVQQGDEIVRYGARALSH